MSRRTYLLGTIAGLLILIWLGYGRLTRYLDARAGEQAFRFGLFDLLLPILTVGLIIQMARVAFAPKPERINDPYADIVVEEWAIARLFRLLFCLVLVFAAIAPFVTPFALVESTGGKVFCFALGVYGLARLAFTPNPRLALSRTGIAYSEVHPAEIAWEDITDVELKIFITTSTIVLKLREAGKFRPAFPLDRWRRLSQIRLYSLYFGIDTADLLKGIEIRRQLATF
jgi:hypothetical protein